MPRMSGGIDMETCDLCNKKIPEGTGDEFTDLITGKKFWLCDDCLTKEDDY